jgi:hypothetical protein
MQNPSANKQKILEKEQQAQQVIKACRTKNGFNASTQYYKQLWLRDLVYSEDILFKLGYVNDIEKHLSKFIRLQQKTGQMPAVIDYSVSRLIRQTYQPCLSDTEILFVIGMHKHAATAGNKFLDKNKDAVNSCLTFLNNKLNAHHLIPGMDWRDAMPVYIGKCLLANQMLLANMYEMLGNFTTSNLIKEKVNELFYLANLGWYADTIHWNNGKLEQDNHFDSLGNALAILNGTASEKISNSILRGFNLAKTVFGYRNIVPYYEFDRRKALTTWYRTCRVPFGVAFRNRPGKYQNSAIWPFIEIRVIDALRKMQAAYQAQEAINLIMERKGFNEYYDPKTGAPEGSEKQLWTATATLSAIGYRRP